MQDRWYKMISLLIAIAACIFAALVVPEIRSLIGLPPETSTSPTRAPIAPLSLQRTAETDGSQTVVPAVTSTIACLAPTQPFADAWASVQPAIGCPVGNSITGLVAEETFQNGKMFWREAIDYGQALVAFADGSWQIYKHAPYDENSPEFSCVDASTPAQCPPTPKRGFGMMWCDIPEIRSGLGNAVDCERGYQGSMQQFELGFMIFADDGRTYVFYDSGGWERR
jgi:hypothetical protein